MDRRLKALLDHLYNEGCSIISTGTCTFSTPMTEAEIDTLVGAFKSRIRNTKQMLPGPALKDWDDRGRGSC